MPTLCLASASATVVVGLSQFTLAWTHSIEKTRWEEDWRVTPAGLQIVAARVRGSGAGIDPPEGAKWRAGAWGWRPALPPQAELVLAASEFTADHELCSAQGRCTSLHEWIPGPGPVRLTSCSTSPTSPPASGAR